MSSFANSSSSSVSALNNCSSYEVGGGNWRHRGRNRQRGMPKTCDKYHLFKWTDESMVEEIKDINVMLSDVKGDISYLKGEVVGLKKKLEGMKKVIVELEKDRIDCINELKSMKNM
ncbi:hypothetical protein YC2023_077342 [Brassica napus]